MATLSVAVFDSECQRSLIVLSVSYDLAKEPKITSTTSRMRIHFTTPASTPSQPARGCSITTRSGPRVGSMASGCIAWGVGC